jgi:hypothetical protein
MGVVSVSVAVDLASRCLRLSRPATSPEVERAILYAAMG